MLNCSVNSNRRGRRTGLSDKLVFDEWPYRSTKHKYFKIIKILYETFVECILVLIIILLGFLDIYVVSNSVRDTDIPFSSLHQYFGSLLSRGKTEHWLEVAVSNHSLALPIQYYF
jgi:hypothetical protein